MKHVYLKKSRKRVLVMELKDLRLYKYLSEQDTKLAAQVESVYNATKDTIDAIAGCYNNYTMHNTGHIHPKVMLRWYLILSHSTTSVCSSIHLRNLSLGTSIRFPIFM